MTWVDLGSAEPAASDELRDAEAGELHIGLARVGSRWIAFDARCPHAQCLLTDGWLEGQAVRCSCHGALFDLETGTAFSGPTPEPLRLFPTRVADGRIEADVG